MLAPVGWQDREALRALKADPGSFALMLGGVRTTAQADAELAEDLRFWSAHGVGMWTVRAPGDDRLLGITGLHDRPDGRGVALRFAFWPEMRGRGLAREAAGAALRFAHDRAGMARVIAIARESNVASRVVLGAIGMREHDAFERGGERVLIYESGKPDPA